MSIFVHVLGLSLLLCVAIPFPARCDDPASPAKETGKAATEWWLEGMTEPIAKLTLGAVIGGLELSKDGQWLYALDLSDGRILRLDPANLRLQGERDLPPDVVGMSLSADGKSLYLAARGPRGNVLGGPGNGLIQSMSLPDLDVVSSFEVEVDPLGISAAADGILAVGCKQLPYHVALVSVPKRTLLDNVNVRMENPVVRVHPGGARAYVSEWKPYGGSFRCMHLWKDQKTGYAMNEPQSSAERTLMGGPFEISPDGKYLAGSRGGVFRLSRARESDLEPAGKVDPHLAAAFSPAGDRLYLAMPAGGIKEIDMVDLSTRRTLGTQSVVTALAVSAKGDVLYAVLASHDTRTDKRTMPTGPMVGDIVAYSLESK